MQDIERICRSPTEEDRQWFPEFAGTGDGLDVLKFAWANFRDESFISQYLSPHLIRQMRLFKIDDREGEAELRVDAIHDELGYREIRRALARHYDVGRLDPDIQIVDVDLHSDRKLLLEHEITDAIMLDEQDAEKVLQHLADLWGYEVALAEVTGPDRKVLKRHEAKPRPDLFF
jgi:spore cortex formation protein SpoVR/YcgB (stage V sporulation)